MECLISKRIINLYSYFKSTLPSSFNLQQFEHKVRTYILIKGKITKLIFFPIITLHLKIYNPYNQ